MTVDTLLFIFSEFLKEVQRVIAAIIDDRASAAVRANLEARGFSVFSLPRCERLPEALASHPDMLMLRLGGELFVEAGFYEENAELFTRLTESFPFITIRAVAQSFGNNYPKDCILNALRMGERLFVKIDTVSAEVLTAAEALGLKLLSVKQGYPACTVLALGETHAITADRGMAKALSGEGIEVLLIDNGDISLPSYEYGFIGGASGVFENKVYFLGDPKTHRCGDEICRFCRAAGYEPVSLDVGILRDLGRIIFIDSEEEYQ